MTVFWICAAVLSLCALSFVLVPAWHERRRSGRWSALNAAAAALLIPFSVALYLGIGTWQGEMPERAGLPPVAELVMGLEARLEADPEDVTGWRLLGQSYLNLGRYAEGARALREAWNRTPSPDNDLKVALGELEVLADRQALRGGAGQLFEEVLEEEPEHPKALWYGGLAAAETGRTELARERWSRLLALGPPAPVEEVLRQQLSQLGGPAPPDTPRAQVAQSAAAGGLEIRLRVSLAENLSAEDLGSGAALFIFARAPQGGPPLAAIRQSASAVPGEFTLSDANAMLPGRSLADLEKLSIVARLSASGQPTASPGDLYGEIVYDTAQGSGEVELLVDRVAE